MSRKQDMDKKKMLRALSKTPIVEAACKQISLPRTTYYRWRREDEKFAEDCDRAIEESAARINDLAESQLISAIKDQNMTAIIFWLKHHHQTYRTRIQVDANVTQDQQALTPEQTEMVAQGLRLAGLTKLPEGENDGNA
jgi:hypothetical protein